MTLKEQSNSKRAVLQVIPTVPNYRDKPVTFYIKKGVPVGTPL